MSKSQLHKLEHSSILLKHKGKNILFDPGNFSTQNDNLHNIDILVITHAHGDHLNIDNINYVNENSENLQIITNSEVANTIKDLGIKTEVVEGTSEIVINDITITAHDHKHEEIYQDFGLVKNTGYYIDDVFFHPGDAFAKPNKEVKAIATVISAPFMRIKMAIDYINENPNVNHIGVHDSVANPDFSGWLKNIILKNIDANTVYIHPESNLKPVDL